MSAQVHILVQFTDGKPSLTLGASYTHKTRSFQVKGQAENYRERIIEGERRTNLRWLQRIELLKKDPDQEYAAPRIEQAASYVKPLPDIRVLTISIPDEGPIGEGIWPSLLGVPALEWA